MNYALLGSLGLLLTTGLAEAAPPGGWGHAPTRLQLCQQEVQDAPTEQRKRLLRDCLARRVEGEQVVAGECVRQLRVGPKRTPAQQRQLSECEARALAQPSNQLPRRPVMAAAPPRTPAPMAPAVGLTPAAVAPGLRTPSPRLGPPLPSGGREGA